MRLTSAARAFLLLGAACLPLGAVAAAGSLMPGDRAVADLLQDVTGGRYAEPVADWLALWWIERALVVAAALLALRRRQYALAVSAILVLGAAALNPALKEIFQRDRPSPDDLLIREPAPGYGFPSGHAMSAALFYGFLVAAGPRLLPRAAIGVVGALSIGAAALIGWDRVYDGAHWPSDVAGGYAFGGLLLLMTLWLARTIGGRLAHPGS